MDLEGCANETITTHLHALRTFGRRRNLWHLVECYRPYAQVPIVKTNNGSDENVLTEGVVSACICKAFELVVVVHEQKTELRQWASH